MKSEQKLSETSLIDPQCNSRHSGKNHHFVFITDYYGIDSAFNEIKQRLRNEPDSFLTLIYSIQWLFPTPLYQSELELMERRFPSKLMTYYAVNCNMGSMSISEIDQQILEVIINSNTSEFMKFQLIGKGELIEAVTDRLLFLGIKTNQIRSQIF